MDELRAMLAANRRHATMPLRNLETREWITALGLALLELNGKLDQLTRSLRTMSAQQSQNFLALQQEVQADTDVMSSAVTAITGIEQQLAAAIAAQNNGDTNALPNLQAQLASARTGLAQAIANVPGGTVTSTDTSTGTATST